MRIFFALLLAASLHAADWPQFRGVNGAGTSSAQRLPVSFGPSKNVVWKTSIPFGHSSPVISGDLIFLTGALGGSRADAGREKVVDQGGKLYTFALSRTTGKILWQQQVPRPRLERYQPTNSPASPSPVTDGENVYVFFGDFGLLSYTKTGKLRWQVPLGPFNNVNGHGSSPIIYKDSVILVCDQDSGSFMIAVDKNTGKLKWNTPRPEVTRSYVTPAIFQPASGPAELIVPGAYQVIGYSPETGEKLWWVRGFSWQPKSLPVIDGNMIYAHGWEGGGDAETPTETPTWEEALAKYDADKDGRITEAEIEERLKKGFYLLDLNGKGHLTEKDWSYYRARRSARNTLVAIRHGGKGDLTATNVEWRMQKFLPNSSSPLIYQGVMYLIKDGGVLTSVDPKTGTIFKQARLAGALDTYYASPVAGAGKIYFVSQQGKVTVIKAAQQWDILATNDMEEETFATPALLENRIYLRTRSTLYSFEDR